MAKNKKFPDDYFEHDKQSLKMDIDKTPNLIKESYNQDLRNQLEKIETENVNSIFFCGMGGSSISGALLSCYLRDEGLRFEIVKNYDLPSHVSKEDIVFITSYSGNTEETRSCYRQARRLGCQVIIVSSGGALKEAATEGRLPFIQVRKGLQPRAALPSLFFSKLRVLEQLGLIQMKTQDVQELLNFLRKHVFDDMAVKLAKKLRNQQPYIYSSEDNYAVAYRWKTQFNENAKIGAHSNRIPEMNHNEICMFENEGDNIHAFFLSFDSDKSRLKKRMSINKDLLTENGVETTQIDIKGGLLKSLFTAVLIGDYTSYYLALLYETDPSPVHVIESLKDKMGPFI